MLIQSTRTKLSIGDCLGVCFSKQGRLNDAGPPPDLDHLGLHLAPVNNLPDDVRAGLIGPPTLALDVEPGQLGRRDAPDVLADVLGEGGLVRREHVATGSRRFPI